MGYSNDLDKVITGAMNDLIKEYVDGAFMFDRKQNEEYLKLYLKCKEEAKNSNFSS